MIQRPQTLFAILAILLMAVLPFTAVADHLASDPQGWWLYALAAALLLAAASSAYGISLFADRPAQAVWFQRSLLFSMVASGVVAGVVGSMLYAAAPVDSEWGSLVVAFGASLSIWLARRGVLADEAKVKSMDRIR